MRQRDYLTEFKFLMDYDPLKGGRSPMTEETLSKTDEITENETDVEVDLDDENLE
jgi:hypothetical protein